MLRAIGLGAILSLSLLSAPADLKQALSLFNSGKYQDCYRELTAYVQQNPESGPAYKVLGMTEFMLGRPEQARDHLILASTLAPKDAESFYYLGRLYFTADNVIAAISAYQKAIEIDPSSVRVQNQLGQSFEALGRDREAEDAYRKAIGLQQSQSKKSEWPYYNLALLCFHNGKREEAIANFRLALVCNPNFANAKVKLAVALADERQADEAERLLRDAIRSDATNAEAHYRLAILLKKAGKQEEAQQQFALFDQSQKR